MSQTSTISLRLADQLIEAIDKSAAQAGQNRTEYIASWLPDAYIDHLGRTETPADKQHSSDR